MLSMSLKYLQTQEIATIPNDCYVTQNILIREGTDNLVIRIQYVLCLFLSLCMLTSAVAIAKTSNT